LPAGSAARAGEEPVVATGFDSTIPALPAGRVTGRATSAAADFAGFTATGDPGSRLLVATERQDLPAGCFAAASMGAPSDADAEPPLDAAGFACSADPGCEPAFGTATPLLLSPRPFLAAAALARARAAAPPVAPDDLEVPPGAPFAGALPAGAAPVADPFGLGRLATTSCIDGPARCTMPFHPAPDPASASCPWPCPWVALLPADWPDRTADDCPAPPALERPLPEAGLPLAAAYGFAPRPT